MSGPVPTLSAVYQQRFQAALLLIYARDEGPLFERLTRAVALALEADVVSIDGFTATGRMGSLGYYPVQRFSAAGFDILRQYLPTHPLFEPLIVQRQATVLRTSDFRPATAFRESELYQLFYRPTGLPLRELIVGFTLAGHGWVTCTLNRSGREFGTAERYLLGLLVPHLQLAVAQASPAPSAQATQLLTLREAQLLGLLRQGLTDKEIGQRLGLSVRTVQNHLQNIYDKLGVRNRTAALLWAMAAP